MTTKSGKPSHMITPMSQEHVRWAIRDSCRALSRGRAVMEEGLAHPSCAETSFALLSRLGVREGLREFFSRLLEGGEEDAKVVDRFIGRFPKGEQRAAGKALFRIIMVNAKEEGLDLELEPAFFGCIRADGEIMVKGSGAALGFLGFCSSRRFTSEELKGLAEAAGCGEVAGMAGALCGRENADSVLCEFFNGVFSVSRFEDEDKREGFLRLYLESCETVLYWCPEAVFSFCFHFCNAMEEGIGEALMFRGVFTLDDTLWLFSGARKNQAMIAELANECFDISYSCAKAVAEHGMGNAEAEKAAVSYLAAYIYLRQSCPEICRPFSKHFRAALSSGAGFGELINVLVGFCSSENLDAIRSLGRGTFMQDQFIRMCFDSGPKQ